MEKVRLFYRKCYCAAYLCSKYIQCVCIICCCPHVTTVVQYLKSNNRYNYSYDSELTHCVATSSTFACRIITNRTGQGEVLFNDPSCRIGFRCRQSYLPRAARPNSHTNFRGRQIQRTDARACSWLLRQLAGRIPTIHCNDSSNAKPG